MPQPTINDVRPVDPVLTDLSIAFKNDRFLWDKIAPPKSTDQQSGTYFIYTRDFWFRRVKGALRGPTGAYTRAGYGVSTDTFKALEYGYEKALGDPIAKASQTPEDLATKDLAFLTNLIQMEIEKQVAAATFVTSVWGTTRTLTGTDQWSDFDGSDPINDAEIAKRTIRRNTGAKVNVLFVGALAWEKLKEHPLLIDKFKHTQVGVLTEELVAGVLGVDELVVGDSVENTGDEGAAFVGADMWTDNALFLVRNEPSLEVSNGAYSFMWNEAGNVPWAAQSYRDETIRAEVQRVFTHLDVQIVSAQHGYILLDSIA